MPVLPESPCNIWGGGGGGYNIRYVRETRTLENLQVLGGVSSLVVNCSMHLSGVQKTGGNLKAQKEAKRPACVRNSGPSTLIAMVLRAICNRIFCILFDIIALDDWETIHFEGRVWREQLKVLQYVYNKPTTQNNEAESQPARELQIPTYHTHSQRTPMQSLCGFPETGSKLYTPKLNRILVTPHMWKHPDIYIYMYIYIFIYMYIYICILHIHPPKDKVPLKASFSDLLHRAKLVVGVWKFGGLSFLL